MTAQGELTLGERLRDAGVAQVLERLTKEERATIVAVILEQTERFAPDDIRAHLSQGIIDKLDAFPNAAGGIFLQLAKADLIEQTGEFGHSPRPERRNGRVFYWRVKQPT